MLCWDVQDLQLCAFASASLTLFRYIPIVCYRVCGLQNYMANNRFPCLTRMNIKHANGLLINIKIQNVQFYSSHFRLCHFSFGRIVDSNGFVVASKTVWAFDIQRKSFQSQGSRQWTLNHAIDRQVIGFGRQWVHKITKKFFLDFFEQILEITNYHYFWITPRTSTLSRTSVETIALRVSP